MVQRRDGSSKPTVTKFTFLQLPDLQTPVERSLAHSTVLVCDRSSRQNDRCQGFGREGMGSVPFGFVRFRSKRFRGF